ncbi:olfactory receptor 5V1-like [Discoglossus pictus]
MYFFLCNLSIQDIVYVTAILPKLLAMTITGDASISIFGCITQFFFLGFCIDTEFNLLTSMAYDRYVAICIPLRYFLIINRNMCALLATSSWLTGLMNASIYTVLMSNLSLCNAEVINNFFCDAQTMLKLSCSDTTHVRIYITVNGALFGWFPFILIMTSYMYIISTILKIQTSSGRVKAFSSCSSHLIIVILFYGASLGLYMKPESSHSQQLDKLLSLLYIAIVPMLNPLVYSLRNKDVLKAMNMCFKNI